VFHLVFLNVALQNEKFFRSRLSGEEATDGGALLSDDFFFFFLFSRRLS